MDKEREDILMSMPVDINEKISMKEIVEKHGNDLQTHSRVILLSKEGYINSEKSWKYSITNKGLDEISRIVRERDISPSESC